MHYKQNWSLEISSGAGLNGAEEVQIWIKVHRSD